VAHHSGYDHHAKNPAEYGLERGFSWIPRWNTTRFEIPATTSLALFPPSPNAVAELSAVESRGLAGDDSRQLTPCMFPKGQTGTRYCLPADDSSEHRDCLADARVGWINPGFGPQTVLEPHRTSSGGNNLTFDGSVEGDVCTDPCRMRAEAPVRSATVSRTPVRARRSDRAPTTGKMPAQTSHSHFPRRKPRVIVSTRPRGSSSNFPLFLSFFTMSRHQKLYSRVDRA